MQRPTCVPGRPEERRWWPILSLVASALVLGVQVEVEEWQRWREPLVEPQPLQVPLS